MIAKLALKNILGAGFRTWLNIFILSLAYFTIISMQGLFVGWNEDAAREIKEWHIAEGQYWQANYDPYDPFTLEDSHEIIPAELTELVENGDAIPILLTPASIYPQGRMQNILLKGIDPSQKLLKIPTAKLNTESEEFTAIIGDRMAKSSELKEGDYVTLRWRDANGALDAIDVKIGHIFEASVLAVDSNVMWIPLSRMQAMLDLKNEATKIVLKNAETATEHNGWIFRDEAFLLQDLTKSRNDCSHYRSQHSG